MNDWSRFGRGDTKGALNFITAHQVRAACLLVKRGQVISLNADLDSDATQRIGRSKPRRTVRLHNEVRHLGDGRRVVVNDDNIEIALQGSTQWDAFAHFGLVESQSADVFYGGAKLDEVTADGRARSLGIDCFGGAVVGRGVLIDVPRILGCALSESVPSGTSFTRTMIEDALEAQGVSLAEGDIAIVYTGFQAAVRKNHGRVPDRITGLSVDTIQLWEEARVAAVASDNLGIEVMDFNRQGAPLDYELHIELLRNLGIPLGELWELQTLVEECRRDNDYTFLLVSVPLNIKGAFGSPANVVAIR